MPSAPSRGKLYFTLLAAFLGWMFDRMEMGIFTALSDFATQPWHLPDGGRVLAGFGALQMGTLVEKSGGSFERTGATIVLVSFIGMIAIWFAPETRGTPLPD